MRTFVITTFIGLRGAETRRGVGDQPGNLGAAVAVQLAMALGKALPDESIVVEVSLSSTESESGA